MYIPEKIIEEIEKRDLRVEDVIVEVLIKELNLDPSTIFEIHLELAERYFGESKNYLARGDAVQASEKLYKVVEECIKALAELLKLPEVEKAKSFGRWFTWLLDKAARKIAKTLNELRIKHVWDAAYSLHVWGFHEAKLSIDDVELDSPNIEWLLKYVKQVIGKERHSHENLTLINK